jgi:DNA/RNA endonuclease YhcR with UshA esterase domain
MRFRLLLVAIVCAHPVLAAAPDFIPIAAARQKAAGAIVTVMGLVTVPSGRFRSSSGDEGFAIQDQTGGIWVSTKANMRLALHQRVWVRGTLVLQSRKLQIVPEDVKPLSGDELRVATGAIGPASLGLLVTVEGRITRVAPDGEYGHKVFIDDGSGELQVFLNKTTDIDPAAAHLQPGRTIRVTGFASQFDQTYELEPRARADIRSQVAG